MVNDYAGPVIAQIELSTNRRDAITQIVDAAEDAIQAIDQDVSELLAQRSRLVSLHNNYVSIFQSLHEEELRTRREVSQISRLPEESRNTEEIRLQILELANDIHNLGINLDEDGISHRLNAKIGTLPWKNPNAVIATVLTRSGKWQKNQAGHYIRAEVEEKDAPPI